MTRHHTPIPFWNLTYNDPNRWKEVEAICGRRMTAWQGIRESIKGRPIGSPRATLIACSGNEALRAILESQSERRIINFEQTSGGVIAYFKVRLELYGIPFRRGEWVGQPTSRIVTEVFPHMTSHFSGKASRSSFKPTLLSPPSANCRGGWTSA